MKNINRRFNRPDAELVKGLSEQSSATIHEAGGKIGAVSSLIKPLFPGIKVCGPALTVLAPAGDNIIVHQALYEAEPGDVLVVNNGGMTEFGFWGEIMAVAAQARGIVGLVTDGAVRDSVQMKERGFPVFAAGVCIKGTAKDDLGFIGFPLNLGGIIVRPGDIVLGDDDGLVVIPVESAGELLEKAENREEKEAEYFKKLENGRSTLELYGLGERLNKLGMQS